MKLRNKKTGEVADLSIFGIELNIRKENQPIYHSLAELNEEWEDYKPKEPYIGDEATAKFVRAWAEHWGIDEVIVHIWEKGLLALQSRPTSIKENAEEIDIQAAFVSGDVKDGGVYTIAELCGEEE